MVTGILYGHVQVITENNVCAMHYGELVRAVVSYLDSEELYCYITI